jgi:hypothetical protein
MAKQIKILAIVTVNQPTEDEPMFRLTDRNWKDEYAERLFTQFERSAPVTFKDPCVIVQAWEE